LAGGACLRLVGTGLYFEWLEGISLLPCLAGVALLFGGWPAWQWSWPAIGFLAFMVPLPYQLKMAMGLPLQRIATVASGYLMQTLGLPAVTEGNTILLSGVKLGIAEACSGLGMLLTFLAVATIVAVVIRRPWWEKIVVLVSAIPIALIANLVRITITGVLHETAGHAVANRVFHDWGGWLMMVLALGLLWLELAFLARLFLEPAFMTPVPLTAARPTSGTRELDSRPRRSQQPKTATAQLSGIFGGGNDQ